MLLDSQEQEPVDRDMWVTLEDLHAQNRGLLEENAGLKQQLGHPDSQHSRRSGCARAGAACLPLGCMQVPLVSSFGSPVLRDDCKMSWSSWHSSVSGATHHLDHVCML